LRRIEERKGPTIGTAIFIEYTAEAFTTYLDLWNKPVADRGLKHKSPTQMNKVAFSLQARIPRKG